MKRLILLLPFLLAACGGQDGSSTSDPVAATASTDPAPVSQAPAVSSTTVPTPTPAPAAVTPAPAVPAPAVTTPTPTPVTPAPTPTVAIPAPVTQAPTPTVTPVVSTPAPIANASTAGIWTIDVPVPTVPDFTFTMFASNTGALFYKYYFAILPYSYNVLEDEYAGTISASVDTLSGSQNEADTIDPTRNCIASNTYCAYTNDPPGAGPITGSIAPGTSITINGATWTASALYDDPSPLSAIEGQWTGYFTGTGQALNATTLVITADGSFLEQDPGTDCIVGGQFSTDDPTQNLYSVSWTYSGSDCLTGLSSATGDAYLDYSVDPIVLHIMAQTAPTGDIVAVSETPVSGT